MKSVIFVTLAVIATARCGILERGYDTIGDAADAAHEGIGDIFETGKDLIFGKGPRAGPDPADQGLIPGMIHKVGEGVHLVGDGISHIFSGDDGIRRGGPLSEMKQKLAAEAAGAAAARAPGAAPVAGAAAAGPGLAVEAAAAAPGLAAEAAAAAVPPTA